MGTCCCTTDVQYLYSGEETKDRAPYKWTLPDLKKVYNEHPSHTIWKQNAFASNIPSAKIVKGVLSVRYIESNSKKQPVLELETYMTTLLMNDKMYVVLWPHQHHTMMILLSLYTGTVFNT